MIRLVTIGGTGDIYMICALFNAFRQHHSRSDVTVVGKAKYAPIAALFGTPYVPDDALVQRAESDHAFQRTYENVMFSPDSPFYVHPCFLRSEIRVDKLTTKPDASQADMYRMILRLPLDVPLAVPTRLPAVSTKPDTVLLIPDAVSWPNTQPTFWAKLFGELQRICRDVSVNEPSWGLGELLERCAASEWVIGPQCGVMSILCTGRFPCRKTLASPALNSANKKLSFLADHTFPYAYVTKFSNVDYDVEEFEVTEDNHEETILAIVNGANALQLRPHDPRPIMTINAPLSPGDFLDRLAVLTVKRRRFSGPRKAAIEREYQRFTALRAITPMPPEVDEHFAQMIAVHETTFDLLERLVPTALASGGGAKDHDSAIRLNRDRVRLKSMVDAACRAPYSEIKSYYMDVQ